MKEKVKRNHQRCARGRRCIGWWGRYVIKQIIRKNLYKRKNGAIKNGKEINMPYVAKPKPCYMDQFEFYKVIDGRKVYRGNGRLYSWDELHGEIEVFNISDANTFASCS